MGYLPHLGTFTDWDKTIYKATYFLVEISNVPESLKETICTRLAHTIDQFMLDLESGEEIFMKYLASGVCRHCCGLWTESPNK